MLRDRLMETRLPGGATWSLTDKTANLTLSNGNRTATNALRGNEGARTNIGRSTGKYYVEITLDAMTSTFASSSSIGVSNASFSFASGFANLNVTGWIFFASSATTGAIYAQATPAVTTITSPLPTHTVCMALDLGAALLWMRDNGGIWNKNAAADPATGVGGVAIGFSGPFFPTIAPYELADSFTLNAGSASFLFGVPSGYIGGF